MTPTELKIRQAQPATVPCGPCRACCKRDTIKLKPQDNLSAFKWHWENGSPTLDRKANRECVYLTERGCSTHDNLPVVCKNFDCRVLYLITPKSRRHIRIKQNPTMQDVYRAGKMRQATL